VLVALSMAASAIAGASDGSISEWLPLFTPEFKDWRESLASRGIEFGLIYVMDNAANVTGGVQRGGIEFGRLNTYFDADLEKLMGWTGAKVHANTFGLYGTGLTHTNILNLAAVSEIEALPDLRLYELWIEQNLFGGALAIRVGQQAADLEFFDSETDDLFINATFGWPAIFAVNLPAGGPSPPIAVPGVRVKAQPAEWITAFGAIFNGNAAGPSCQGEPQHCDDHGLAMRVNDDPLFMGQVRFDYDLGFGRQTLPGNFTPGGWYHAGEFERQRFTAGGMPIVGLGGPGMPKQLNGNNGIFAVLEQTLYRAPGDTTKGVSASAKGVTAFARIAHSPPDRNLIDLYADAGIGFSRLVPGRPDDRFGFAAAYMHISHHAREADNAIQNLTGEPMPLQTFEAVVEAIYEAHVMPGLLVQPFFQYIIRPAGGVPNPYNPPRVTTRIGDAAVFGLTSTMKF
jgi:porin